MTDRFQFVGFRPIHCSDHTLLLSNGPDHLKDFFQEKRGERGGRGSVFAGNGGQGWEVAAIL